ncbi:MAG: hypothetical protein FWD35_00690 [Oscillospiraceae bacterium]|nr:hypothetical protein [Oscillospiraceae bacterium]
MNNRIKTTTLAFLAVFAVIITAAVLVSCDRNTEGEHEVFQPTANFRAEVEAAATKLIRNNAEVFRVFNTIEFDFAELSHFRREPYGALSADGYFTLRDEVLGSAAFPYKSVDEIFALVRETYVEAVADVLIADSIYKERGGGVGVRAGFEPVAQRTHATDFSLTFVSEILVLLEENIETGGGNSGEIKMLKTESGWRLEKLMD